MRRLPITIHGEHDLEAEAWIPDGRGPAPAVVVCHPHPRQGGTMHNPVVEAVLSALTGRGMAGVRFNFRGVGRSGGEYGEGRGEQSDLRAVVAGLAAVPEIDASVVALAGYSFGAVVAAAVADEGCPALALISFPPGLTAQLTGRPPERLLGDYGHPLLLVSGSQDTFSPADAIADLAAVVGGRAAARIVPGANHFWAVHDGTMAEHVATFFASHLLAAGGPDAAPGGRHTERGSA